MKPKMVHCEHCKNSIEKTLEKLADRLNTPILINIALENRTITLETTVSPEQIINTLNDIGFEAKLEDSGT